MKRQRKYAASTDESARQVEEPGAGYYTYQDYVGFEFEHLVELIRGKIFRMTPAPGTTHQKISHKITLQIGPFFEKSICQFFSAPTDVILPLGDPGREDTVVQPDHFIVCDPQKIKEAGCFGAPDWIIEILSPNHKKKDLRDKYEVYELAGVREYWIVFPKDKIVEMYVLVDEKYTREGAYTEDEIISPSVSPELKCDLSYIFS